LDADNVTVQIGASEYTYPVSEVEKYWYGKYVLLWRPPSLEYDVINAVSTGPDVQWLRQVLNRVAREDGAGAVDVGNSAYDEELRKRIVSFQKNHDLDADGVVGADTLLHLNTLLNEPNIPLLTRSPTN
jgi:general secretion pathway protein A